MTATIELTKEEIEFLLLQLREHSTHPTFNKLFKLLEEIGEDEAE